jgi:T5SS/PEP-CTERM-associated repeat protein
VKVEGTGSTFNSYNLYVGNSGSGMLKVLNGGTVLNTNSSYLGYQAGSTGDALVDGTNSIWTSNNSLHVGYAGSGKLDITNGGMVIGKSECFIGYDSGSTGIVNVEGANSTLNMVSTNGTFYIGRSGSGTLNIKNGGTVINYISYLGGSPNVECSVTVNGIGSSWTNSNKLSIGGKGTMNITGGGTVSSGFSVLGAYAGSTSVVNIEGAGSQWNPGSVIVGETGSGTMNVRGGGFVGTINGHLGDDRLGYFEGSSGTVNIEGNGSTWTSSLNLYIGDMGAGKLYVRDGGTVSSQYAHLGMTASSEGFVDVDGPGSTWKVEKELRVGKGTIEIHRGGSMNSGYSMIGYGSVVLTDAGSNWTAESIQIGWQNCTGSLSISSGSSVSVAKELKIAPDYNSKGSIHIEMGGTLTATTMMFSPSQISGNGTINAKGIVSDSDLIFDATHDTTQSFLVNDATLNLALDASGDLGAGYSGTGSLNIRDGKNVISQYGIAGYLSHSTGTITVDGPATKWTNKTMIIGYDGKGTLNITSGAVVESQNGTTIGLNPYSTGAINVEGIGSTLISKELKVGYYGKGALNISGGGTVVASSVKIPNNSLLAIDVGMGSKLIVNNGAGAIVNDGTIRILAGAGALKNTNYAPISAASYQAETVQAVGGKWDSLSRQFSVFDVQAGVSGNPVAIDRLSAQRLLISDNSSDWVLGASFVATATSTPLTFTATAIEGSTLDKLKGMIGAGDSLLGGWTLAAATGYAAGDPVYLSFGNGGGGYAEDKLQVWSYDGTTWAKFAADDLTFDGSYASFTTTALGTFAVSVPEPGMGVLLLGGLAAAWVLRRRWAG